MPLRRYTLAQASLAESASPISSAPLSSNQLSRTAVTNPKIEPFQQSSVFNWSPFNFLRDGTLSLRNGTSKLLGEKGKASVITPKKPTGGLLSSHRDHTESESNTHEKVVPATSETPTTRDHKFPSWSTWKDWKKLSLDFYIRLVDRPKDARVRLKQTVAVLPVLKLKPVIDFTYRGPDLPPVAMHLDIKLLDCFKYRLRQDGSSTFQVRAKAPLSDPRFLVDVVYERDLQTAAESVKLSFRALEVAFLKAPGFGTGIKFPVRFANGIKSTIRVKKYLTINGQVGNRTVVNQPLLARRSDHHARGHRGRLDKSSVRTHGTSTKSHLGIVGPTGVDLKVRCLEFR